MATLLQIDVSTRGDYSVSRKLTAAFAEEWKNKHAGGTVTHRDLTKTELTFVDMNWIGGAYSTPDQQTPDHKQALKLSDELIAELFAADEIVIGAPMYNFGVPASLKAWIDHICRVNKTFSVGPGGYKGLVTGKKATFIIASGGNYAPGAPAETYNSETPYLKAIFGFLGVTDTKVVFSGSTSEIDQKKTTLEQYLPPHLQEVKASVQA